PSGPTGAGERRGGAVGRLILKPARGGQPQGSGVAGEAIELRIRGGGGRIHPGAELVPARRRREHGPVDPRLGVPAVEWVVQDGRRPERVAAERVVAGGALEHVVEGVVAKIAASQG